MERALLACIEAIFVVMGRPQPEVRQCPLAMDKWTGMRVSHKAILLGLEFDSRMLTVGIPRAYLDEVQAIIDLTLHQARKSFTVHKIELLEGKLGRLGEDAPWVYHLMTHI